ncbi:MAG: CvpA family protein [Clostridiales bacterium]|jgi:uncharacterized membrane protein required for colicin V production|nr:CvpA family protein [Clostridiales bacterium]
MNIVLDLILIGILALCVLSGYKKGLILGISGILALVVAFYGANLVAETFSSDFTSMIEPMISNAVSGAVDESQEELPADEDDGEQEVYQVSYDSLKKLGVLETTAKKLAGELKDELREVGSSLKSAIVHKLSGAIAYAALLIIVFVLIIIVFKLLANAINFAFKLPGLNLINGIGGAALGFVKGMILLFILSWAAGFLGFILPEAVVNKTVVLKWLMNNNPITALFGI